MPPRFPRIWLKSFRIPLTFLSFRSFPIYKFKPSNQRFFSTSLKLMAPINWNLGIETAVSSHLTSNKVVIFSKSYCPFCKKVKQIFTDLGVEFEAVELDQTPHGDAVQDFLLKQNGIRTVPQVYIDGKFVGDSSKISSLKESGELDGLLGRGQEHEYDYDLIVIGGGSGGLSCSREAAKLGKKVAVLDYVSPSPQGTKWGLGGTCVNVGCIPKKLFHQAALHHQNAKDMIEYGWQGVGEVSHDWNKLVQAVQDHIGSLNWGYRVALRDEKVEYINAMGSMIDAHTVACTTFDRKTGKPKGESKITAKNVVIATGGRPKYLGLENDKELCITSDDLFSLDHAPGKTLVVGASYVALECAGFLTELGYDTTVMARSIFLRGFDQQMAEKVVGYMAEHGTKFIRPAVPEKLEKVEGGVKVEWMEQGVKKQDVFETVLLAIGREAKLEGVKALGLKEENGKLVVSKDEATNVEGVYAIGDVLYGKPELTPLAIHAGKLLARRLFGKGHDLTDYENIPTAVFTPLEYGAIGLSEEDAVKKYGQDDVEVYHGQFKPLEWTVPHREDNACYAKLVCVKSLDELVVGFHYLGPNAGEVTQGYAVGMRLGAKKKDFSQTIGIHPTTSEEVIKLKISKSSGEDATVSGC